MNSQNIIAKQAYRPTLLWCYVMAKRNACFCCGSMILHWRELPKICQPYSVYWALAISLNYTAKEVEFRETTASTTDRLQTEHMICASFDFPVLSRCIANRTWADFRGLLFREFSNDLSFVRMSSQLAKVSMPEERKNDRSYG